MPVVLVMAAVAILAGVVVVAVGRGGELAIARSDIPPVRFALFTPADVAAFRPRLAFFGYSARATDDALLQIARAVAERDAELSRLRVQLTALRDQLDDGAEPGLALSPGADQESEADRGMTITRHPDAGAEAARDEPEPADAWLADRDEPEPADAWPAARDEAPAPASPAASRSESLPGARPDVVEPAPEPEAWPSVVGHAPEPAAWLSVVGHPPEPDEPGLAGEQAPVPEPAAAPRGSEAPAVAAGPAGPAAVADAGEEDDPVARFWDEDR
ncbi:MAG TPA: hypothetical protein VGG35_23895 [Streptosporangiaceae bacterium]|jgi:hypothetical protein